MLREEKKPKHQPGLLYPEKFPSEVKENNFSDKQKLRKFVVSRSALQEMLR